MAGSGRGRPSRRSRRGALGKPRLAEPPSPTIVTSSQSRSARTPSQAARSSSSSRCAADERRVVASLGRGVDAQQAVGGTGSALPLRSSGSTGSTSTALRTSAKVGSPISTSPAVAACSSRAATLTASPVASRSSVPVTTSPVMTPIRPSSPRSGSASRISSAARTARSASSSWTVGTPKTAMTASPMNFSTVPPWCSTIALHALEVAREQRAEPLGVDRLAERGGAGEVAEEDGDRLPLGLRRRSGRRLRAALGAEPERCVRLEAAARTGRHTASLGGPSGGSWRRRFRC